jgi:hypothetical protein
VGQSQTFSVTATGSTPLSYQWYKDTSSITSATNNTYTINSVGTTDAGTYYCIVTNSCGSAQSTNKVLVVNTAPGISSQSSNTAVCSGQSVTLSVTATGSSPLTYQWYYNSSPITGATNNSFTISSAGSSNSGTYYCTVTNSCSTATSTSITLTVSTAPSITAQSSGATRCVGQSQTFSITATGSTPLTYQWYFDTAAISGATNNTYTINSLATSHSGTYYCIVSNHCGWAQSTYKVLTVNTAPSITTQTGSQTVCSGQPLNLSITASGSAPLTYQWYYNSSPVSNATNNIYGISSALSSHAGSYYCIVTNSCSTAQSNTSTLTVNTAPAITSQTSGAIRCTGQSQTFSITATGSSPLTYQWYKDTAAISSATNNSYTINSLTAAHSGTYYCIVSNSCGTAQSTNKVLVVNSPPSITSQTSNTTLCSGQGMIFNVTANGSTPLSYQWYFNSSSISGATNNNYIINSAISSNTGTYYCIVSNSCGTAQASNISLTVNTAPSITSQTGSASRCTGQSQTFSVTVTGTAPITYQWYRDTTTLSGATNNTYTINALTVNDAGNYYCIARNSCGTVQSNLKIITVNTPPDITYQSPGSSICEGNPLALNVAVTGSNPMSYQWYLNSNPITGAITDAYTISTASTIHTGTYYCRATNMCGSDQSANINMVINTPPNIISQSGNVTFCVGQSVMFSITATGTFPLSYQWYEDSSAINGATNTMYAINNIVYGDAGNYYCIVSNMCGDIQSLPKTLNVNVPPALTSYTPNSDRCEGENIIFTATTDGTQPIYYQWYKDGAAIYGAVFANYTRNTLKGSDSGNYFCIASNICGQKTTPYIHLYMYEPVTVYKQARDTSKCIGDATLFYVNAKGTQPITYQWYFQDNLISGADSNYYYLDSLTTSDEGIYYCELTNTCGTVRRGERNLIVQVAPDIRLGNDTTFCLGGETVLQTGGIYSTRWSNGSTLQDLRVTHSGTFWVNVTDMYGCKATSDTINITVLEPYPDEEICMVTVDTSNGKNLIVWERTAGRRTAYYKIYKETTQAGIYDLIGTLPFDSLSVFVDFNSNPRRNAERYAISVVDSCNNESALSTPHKTIHLTASQGTSGENNLNWSDYEGFNFQTYKIYRGTSPSNLSYLGSVQSTLSSYTDLAPPSGVVYYQVSAVKMDTCYPDITRAQTSSGPYSQSISNLKDYTQITTNYLTAYPYELAIGFREGSKAFINVYTNLGNWDAYTGANWLIMTKDPINSLIELESAENYLQTPRSEEIKISGNGVPDQIVTVTQEGTTGVFEDRPGISLKVYPNPFNDKLNIEYDIYTTSEVSIGVYNLLGNLVTEVTNEKQIPGSYSFAIDDFSNLNPEGVYFVRVVVNGDVFTRKLIRLNR